jgi:hypothetical protein
VESSDKTPHFPYLHFDPGRNAILLPSLHGYFFTGRCSYALDWLNGSLYGSMPLDICVAVYSITAIYAVPMEIFGCDCFCPFLTGWDPLCFGYHGVGVGCPKFRNSRSSPILLTCCGIPGGAAFLSCEKPGR